MRIETNLNIEKYVELVEQIAAGFFADDGSYAPHLGRINAMGMFADYCVKESKWDGLEEVDANDVLTDEEFLDAYEREFMEGSYTGLNFSNAYNDAMDIVKQRNSSIVQAANFVVAVLEKALTPDSISAMFESSERLKEIANADPDKVVSLFQKATK